MAASSPGRDSESFAVAFRVRSDAYMQCSHATGHSSLRWMKKLDPRSGTTTPRWRTALMTRSRDSFGWSNSVP
ncbi:hypothetical protein [Streptomyces sp. Agncl-13]|uniref:hypothetical protein n=1 Tax=Streptomyces sp. Agncl-13 TaxID=3400628 RepID=UPI003A88DB5A